MAFLPTDNPLVAAARGFQSIAHGYNQAKRYDPYFFDCSSLVHRSLLKAGYNPKDKYITTANLRPNLLALGWTEKRITPEMASQALPAGYIVLKDRDANGLGGHTAITTGGFNTVEAANSKLGVLERPNKSWGRYTAVFVPPNTPFTTPTQVPMPSSGSAPQTASPVATANLDQHEPAPNQTWLGNGYGMNNNLTAKLMAGLFNNMPYVPEITKQAVNLVFNKRVV